MRFGSFLRSHQGRAVRVLSLGSALVGIGLAAKACGGSGPASPGVASVGSSTTTTKPHATQGGNKATAYADAVAYAACMRTNGVPNMPDPDTSGGSISIRPPAGMGPGSTAFVRAQRECRSSLPGP